MPESIKTHDNLAPNLEKIDEKKKTDEIFSLLINPNLTLDRIYDTIKDDPYWTESNLLSVYTTTQPWTTENRELGKIYDKRRTEELLTLLKDPSLTFDEKRKKIKDDPYWTPFKIQGARDTTQPWTMEREELRIMWIAAENQKYYKKYLAIKDNPKLNPNRLLSLLRCMDENSPEFHEVDEAYAKLLSDRGISE